jgi:hypothetical protein
METANQDGTVKSNSDVQSHTRQWVAHPSHSAYVCSHRCMINSWLQTANYLHGSSLNVFGNDIYITTFLVLGFINRLFLKSLKKSQRFEGWIFLRLQVERGNTLILLDPVDRAIPNPQTGIQQNGCLTRDGAFTLTVLTVLARLTRLTWTLSPWISLPFSPKD